MVLKLKPIKKLKDCLSSKDANEIYHSVELKMQKIATKYRHKSCSDCGTGYELTNHKYGPDIECECKRGRLTVRSDGNVFISWWYFEGVENREKKNREELEESAKKMQGYKETESEQLE